MALVDGVKWLVSLGLLDTVLPFILVFALVYGILERTKVLGEEQKKPRHRLNAMVAFVLGFLAIASLKDLVAIQTFSVITSVVAIVLVLVLLIAGLVGVTEAAQSKLVMGFITSASVIGVLYFLDKIGILPHGNEWWTTPVLPVLLGFIVLFFVIYWAAGGSKAAKKEEKAEKPANGKGNGGKESGKGDSFMPGFEGELNKPTFKDIKNRDTDVFRGPPE